jgi:hypothetical protein
MLLIYSLLLGTITAFLVTVDVVKKAHSISILVLIECSKEYTTASFIYYLRAN